MIVVADASPIQYVVRTGAVNILAPLCERGLLPATVAQELQMNNEGRREAAMHIFHLSGLLNFETALARLRLTNFYVSDAVVGRLRERLRSA